MWISIAEYAKKVGKSRPAIYTAVYKHKLKSRKVRRDVLQVYYNN